MSEPIHTSQPEPRTDSTLVSELDRIRDLVSAQFDVEEALIEHGVHLKIMDLLSLSRHMGLQSLGVKHWLVLTPIPLT